MLASYGIETAADVNRTNIMQIPGFGEALTSELAAWRRLHERNFRFNPNEPIDSHDINSMDRDLAAVQQRLLSTLREGLQTLQRISREIPPARQRMEPMLEKAWTALRWQRRRATVCELGQSLQTFWCGAFLLLILRSWHSLGSSLISPQDENAGQ